MLVEEMYKDSDGTPVTLVVHSMGGPVTLYFLTNVVTQEWKDKYINAFIPLSGAWAGATEALLYGISGIDTSSRHKPRFCRVLNCSVLRPFIRSLQSLSWLLPRASIWKSVVLVTTPNKTYNASDYADLFEDIGDPQRFDIYVDAASINAEFPAPNVTVHCFYGTGVETIESLTYDIGFPDTHPNITYGDGDGSVNTRSSEVCLKWAEGQTHQFFNQTFPGVDHNDILSDTNVLQAVEKVVIDISPRGCAVTFTPFTVVINVVSIVVAYVYSN